MFSSNPNSCHPRKGEQLEMELIIDCGYMRRPPKSQQWGEGVRELSGGQTHLYQNDMFPPQRTSAYVQEPPRLVISLHLAVHLHPLSVHITKCFPEFCELLKQINPQGRGGHWDQLVRSTGDTWVQTGWKGWRLSCGIEPLTCGI